MSYNIPGVNKNLVQGCCTFRTITFLQIHENQIWAIELQTEVGEKYYFKVYNTDQFNPNPTVYDFETPVQNSNLYELCHSNDNKEIKIETGETTLVFVANLLSGEKNGLYAYVKTKDDTISFVISKNWFEPYSQK